MTMQQQQQPAARALATQYKGVLFRSRLEAKWAAFFDLLGWPWAYEPVDLDFYIPDFLLTFPDGDVAVEVKPETQLVGLRQHARHAILCGWKGEVLSVGARIFDDAIIGVSFEPDGPEHIHGAARAFRCIDCGHASFLNEDHGWRCRSNGCYGGNAHLGDMTPSELEGLWKQAGNRVQWHPHTEVR